MPRIKGPMPYKPEMWGPGQTGLNPFGPANQQPIGPGGEIGVEHDYGLRDNFAMMMGNGYLNNMTRGWEANRDAQMQGYLSALNGNNAIRSQAAGLVSAADRDAALGYLNDPRETARRGSIDGGISDLEFEQGITSAKQDVAGSARAMQGAIQSVLSQKGISNPLAGIVTGMAGQFAAGGAAGRARSNMTNQRSQNRLGYTNIYGNIAGQQANIKNQATQEGALSMMQPDPQMPTFQNPAFDMNGLKGIYDTFRNQNPRPDTANWNGQNGGIRGTGGGGGGMLTWGQKGYLG